MHDSHRVCIFLMPPQAGHLLRAVTSLSALPAICRCLFFMCDVLLLGTARRMPSQMSPSSEGSDWMAAGTPARAEIEGKRGWLNEIWWLRRAAERRGEAMALVEAEAEAKRRGSSEGPVEATRSCWTAAIAIV